MKRYETYKDSGIQWVGEIPSHWDSNKLKFFADISTGTTPSTANEEYWNEATENWYTPADFNEGDIHLNGSSRKVSAMAFEKSACKVFKKNVVLVVGIGATLGKIGFSRVECSANQQINAIEFYDNVYPLFGAYYLSSLKEVMKSLASAATLAIMNQSVTGSIPFVCPTLAEQKNIATYLDHKVGQIDATIAEKEQMLEDLKAYRSSIISEAVTKGLDKNVEMKESGVEWIGMIPKHWNINKLKFFADISTGTTPSTDNEEYWKEPTENWYTPSDFCEEKVHLETSSRKVSTTAFQESACRVFKKDVVLVVGIGATLGKIGISSVECSANQQINAIEFYDNVYPLFGAYYLSSLKEVMKSLASAATLAIMNQSVTGSIPFVCPTLDEQKEIADYLEKKTKSIGSLLNQIEVQIVELKSYKSTLITEAVTGKIDLRDWKPKEENV